MLRKSIPPPIVTIDVCDVGRAELGAGQGRAGQGLARTPQGNRGKGRTLEGKVNLKVCLQVTPE